MRKNDFVFHHFCIPIVNLGYFAKHRIIHPILIFRNSKIAQIQGFFIGSTGQSRLMSALRNSAVTPHK